MYFQSQFVIDVLNDPYVQLPKLPPSNQMYKIEARFR